MKRKLKKTVACRICGKRMQNLTVHLIKIHKMSVDEYKKEYDVDSVFADRLRARMSDVHRKHKSNRPYIPMTRKGLLRSLVKMSKKYDDITPGQLKSEWPALYNQLQRIFGKVSTAFREVGLGAQTKKRWNKEKVIQAIETRMREGRSVYASDVFNEDCKLWSAGQSAFGTWTKALKAAGLSDREVRKRREYTDPQLLEMAKESASEQGVLRTAELDSRMTNLSRWLRNRFGSIQEAAALLGMRFEPKKEPWTKERVLEQIRRRHKEKQPLSVGEIKNGAPGLHYGGKIIFGTWAKALKAAGLSPDDYNTRDRLTEAELKEAVRKWCRKKGPLDATKLARSNYRLYRRVCRRFGSIKDAAGICRVPVQKKTSPKRRSWTPKRVIATIRRMKSLQRISAQNPPLYGAAIRHFGSWKKAVEEAGIGSSRHKGT